MRTDDHYVLGLGQPGSHGLQCSDQRFMLRVAKQWPWATTMRHKSDLVRQVSLPLVVCHSQRPRGALAGRLLPLLICVAPVQRATPKWCEPSTEYYACIGQVGVCHQTLVD